MANLDRITTWLSKKDTDGESRQNHNLVILKLVKQE